VSQKEKALNKLNDRNLLELARSVSKNYVDSGTSRNNLVKIVKASLSIEEIKQKINQTKSPLDTSTRFILFLVFGILLFVGGLILGLAYALPLSSGINMLQQEEAELAELGFPNAYASDIAQAQFALAGDTIITIVLLVLGFVLIGSAPAKEEFGRSYKR
jgi:hypothetical protein